MQGFSNRSARKTWPEVDPTAISWAGGHRQASSAEQAMETPRNADSAAGSASDSAAPGSAAGVPSALADFVRDAEQTLDDEARMAIMSPPSGMATSSSGDICNVSSVDQEKGASSPVEQHPPTSPENSKMENISLEQETNDGSSSAAAAAAAAAAATALPSQNDETSTHSPFLAMKAAKNTMLVAADSVKFLFGANDTTDSSLHDFDGLYSLGLASQLREMYRTKTLCDITVDCAGQDFDFQRVILSCGSGYFRKLLQEDPNMSSHTIHFDPTISTETFDSIAESLYTGAITKVNFESSIPLLKAAYFLDVEHATAQCTEYLLSELDQDNCLEIWKAARFCSNETLLVASTAKIGRHLPTVASTDLFLDLPTEMLIDLLSDDGLEIPNEMVVYESAITWIRHDTANREGLLAQVLKVVRFPFLSTKCLTDVVATEELVMSNHDAMHMYSKAMRFKLAGKKFPEGEAPVKRRDHIKHELRGGYERYQKEQKIKRQVARDAPPDERSWEERVEDMRDNFMRMFHEHLLLNKFVLAPLVFCKDQIFIKHIVAPIKKSPCIPNKTVDGEGDGDDGDWNNRNALAVGPDMAVPHEESFFVKYIARPIERSPCMPADSDDDEDYDDEAEDSPYNPPGKEEPKEVDPALLGVLDDSVWTKYEVKVQKPLA